MILFRQARLQRTIAGILLFTFGSSLVTPMAVAAQSVKQASSVSAPTASSILPLQANTAASGNAVLLPVGSRGMPLGQGIAGNKKAAVGAANPATVDPAAAYAAALASLHELTEQANLKPASGKQSAASLLAAVNALRAQYSVVVQQQQQMNQAFAATQSFIAQQGLPSTILQRQQAVVAAFASRAAQLQQTMAALDAVAAGKGDAQTALTQLLQFVQQYPSESAQSPNSTSPAWGKGSGKAGKSQAHEQLRAGIKAAANSSATGTLSGISLPTAVIAANPGSADTAATDDVQLTPAITALAASLGNNPVAIYEYVHNNIQYQVGYGSLQGAAQTLQAQSGNDIDSASLLIALYRAAGIPARYVYGTIEVPISRLQAWLQVDNAAAAQTLLSQAGIPNSAISSGGQISAVDLEHVWVQAYVDASPSGGAVNRNPSTWVPLDPSFKQNQQQAGLPLAGAVSLNAAGVFDGAANNATCTADYGAALNQSNLQTSFSAYQSQLQQYLTSQGSDLTVGGLLGQGNVAPENYSILLGSLPYATIAQSAVFDAVPVNLQGALHLQLYSDSASQAQGEPAVAYSASAADLAGKRLTLSFAPATADDAATLAAYLPKSHSDGSAIQAGEFPASIPGYLINVTANIELDGQTVASGGSFVLGSELIGSIGHYDPAAGAWNDTGFVPYAGDYHAVVSDTQGINAAQIGLVQTRLAATAGQLSGSTVTSLSRDSVTGDLLNQTALAWFATVDANSAVFQRAAGIVEQRLQSYGRAIAPVQPHLVLGIVDSVSFPGVSLDIDHLSSAVASQSNGISPIAYTRQSNERNAAYAHLILEQHYGGANAPGGATQAVSAVRLLAQAAAQTSPAEPVYALTSANLAQDQASISLSAAQTTDLQNAVGAGNRVTIAQHAATLGNWTGQGMQIEDPATGAGIYRISGSAGTADANSSATAALYPSAGMGWLALAQPNQAAAAVSPAYGAANSIDSSLVNILSNNGSGNSNNGSSLRWSYYAGQADVANGLFLANLAAAENASPSACQSLTAILAANLGTSTGTGSASGSTTGTGGSTSVPVITSAPVTAGTAGQAYQYPVAASDPAGAALSYSLPTAPGGMSISATGIINWANPVAGIASVTVRADNGKAYAQQSYQLTIGTQPLPLSVSLAVAPGVVNVGQNVSITVATNGGSGSISTALTIDGSAVNLTPINAGSSSVTVTGNSSGAHLIVATASDAKGSVSQTSLYSVTDPSDTGSPVALITSPILDATLSQATPIIGSASDQSLAYYQILMAPAGSNTGSNAGSSNWSEIARGYHNVVNGTLGSFDPTQLPNGIYQLALNVVNVNGVQTSNLITVEVKSHLKIGQFSLSFQDLNVQASGIPIQITRTYDTRRRAQNLDFGYGWSIDYQNLQISKNITMGLNWNVVANPTNFALCLQPGQQHKVDVILPTGELAQFSAANAQACATGSVPDINIEFTALPGTSSTLAIDYSVTGSPNLEAQGGMLYDMDNQQAWNPQNYTLTTADNYVYSLTDGIGITKVTDPNGNTLTYGQNGILHSNGTGIAFTRDANNHITQITDPNGYSINYRYSATGDLTSVNDRNNATSSMAYDNRHGLASYTDPDGNLTARYVYDATGKLIAAYDAKGNAIQTQHNPNQDVVTDQRGNTTTYTFDGNGNITQITNALNQTTNYTFDANGNQTSVTDALGNTTSTTSDPQSFLQTSSTDPLGHTTAWSYDNVTHGMITGITDANGNHTAYSYGQTGTTEIDEPLGRSTIAFISSAGNMVQLSVAGQVTSYGYDAKGNKTVETDAAGNVINYTYDANGNQLNKSWSANGHTVTATQTYDGNNNLLTQTDALGNTSKTQYTAANQVAATLDAQGRSTSFQYDVTGKLASTTYPDGTSETNTYDAAGNKISSTDRQGRTTQYQYDVLNRLTGTIAPDGSSTGMTYDAAGRVATSIDAKGNVTSNGYDAAGRLTSVTDALGKQTQYNYDAVGNRTSTTDALGNQTQYQFDALNRLTQTTYPDGKLTSTVWRTDGKKQSDTDQQGNVTAYAYDPDGRLNQVTQTNAATQQQTVYGYDSNGNKISQTDANGNNTQWTYDANNRVTSRTLPAGQKESFQYDVNGNLLAHTDFKGATTSYSYNSNGQQIQEQRPDGATIITAYTPTGQVASTTVTSTNSSSPVQIGQTDYTYDANDRVTKQTNPDGSFVAYAYDANGNITQRSNPGGTSHYAYDSNQRLVGVTDITGKTTSYTYDSVGRKAGMADPNGVTASYTYDSNNRLLQVLHVASSGTVVAGSSYVLAANGQRTQVQEFDSQSTVANNVASNPVRTTAYTYDGVNRLTQEAMTDRTGNTTTTAYQYDATGNRAQKTTTTATGVETVTYSYDSNDRLTQEVDTIGSTQTQTSYTWDANGNLQSKTTNGLITFYLWDSQNRLVEEDQGATQATASVVAKYTYDATGNRVQRSEPQSGQITSYLPDTSFAYTQVLRETAVLGTSSVTTDYSWGDNLISINSAGQQSYVHADGLGSTKALTNASGVVNDTYVYDAFGKTTNQTGTIVNPYRYTGEYFDDATGLVNLRARWLDSSLGRFNSLDPFGGKQRTPLSLNKYIYANADPINGKDPSGLTNMVEVTETEDVEGELSVQEGELGGETEQSFWKSVCRQAASFAGPYGKLSKKILSLPGIGSGKYQNHHILQDADMLALQARLDIKYSSYKALAFPFFGGTALPGSPHGLASAFQSLKQNQLGPDATFAQIISKSRAALIVGGCSPADADSLVAAAVDTIQLLNDGVDLYAE